MLEQRPYTPRELLTWCQFLAQTMLGSALAYVKERDGTADELIDYLGQRLSAVMSGAGATGGPDAALLALLLSVQSLGGEVESRAANPEAGEVVVADLPGQHLSDALHDEFDVELAPGAILQIAGVSRDELNRLLDVLGSAAAGTGLEYRREPEDGAQRLTLRSW